MKKYSVAWLLPAAFILFFSSCSGTGVEAEEPSIVQILEVGNQGYVTSGSWAGYAWIGTSPSGTTVTPADFLSLSAGGELRIQGTVAADAGSGNNAMIGINLNQAVNGSTLNSAAMTGTGIAIRINNGGGTSLRLGLYDQSAGKYFWADISGSGGKYPYGGFNTTPWDTAGGEYYTGASNITSALVSCPGDPTNPVNYDFTLQDLYAYTE